MALSNTKIYILYPSYLRQPAISISHYFGISL